MRDIAKICENVEQGGQSPMREGEGALRILLRGGVTTLLEGGDGRRKRRKEKGIWRKGRTLLMAHIG